MTTNEKLQIISELMPPQMSEIYRMVRRVHETTDPGSMTLAELRRYVRLFKLTPRDVCAVVGVEEGGIK